MWMIIAKQNNNVAYKISCAPIASRLQSRCSGREKRIEKKNAPQAVEQYGKPETVRNLRSVLNTTIYPRKDRDMIVTDGANPGGCRCSIRTTAPTHKKIQR